MQFKNRQIANLMAWWRGRVSLGSFSVAILLVFVAFLTLYPVGMIVYGSFNSGSPLTPSGFSLGGYTAIIASVKSLNVFWTTVWLAAVRTAFTMAITVFLAWVVTRTDTPLRGLLSFLVTLRFFLPYMVFILAWSLLLSPKSGFINVLFMNLTHSEQPLFNIYSYGGIILVSTLAQVPVMFLIVMPALVNLDASLEESSRMSGANNFTTLLQVTLPLVAPAILGATILSFINFMESFETEAFLGFPARIYVLTTQIYSYIHVSEPSKYPPAMAMSVLLLAAMTILILYQWRWIGTKQYRYATVTGRGYAVRPVRLGSWRYVTLSLVLLYFVVSTLIPGVFILVGPFMKMGGLFVGDWFTLEHWGKIFARPEMWGYLRNSFILAVGAATVGVLLFSLMSYVVVRTRYVSRGLLEFVSWVPYTMPGIVLALGMLWVFVGSIQIPLVSYGSIQLLMLALIIRRMPLGVRLLNGVFIQINKELEEASRIHGASWWNTFRHIMLPLLRPGLVSAWLLMAVYAVKELVIVLMLYGPRSVTLSAKMWDLALVWGDLSQALILGLMETAMCIVFWLGARLVTRQSGGAQMAGF